jgi:hypothetical protein
MGQVEDMPAARSGVVSLVRSRLGRRHLIRGFFLAGAIVLGCAGGRDVASPRDPAPAIGSKCVAPRSTGPVERMPFGLYSAAVADFGELARNGFTMVGPWYVPAPDRALLDAASAAGLGVVFPLGDPQGRTRGAFAASAADTWASTTSGVHAVADHPAVIAWYVLPEEVRYWEPDELAHLATTTAAIRAADPRRRPILSYQPNDHDRVALAPVLEHLDVATKGMYPGYAGHGDARAFVPWSVDELEAASDSPAWVVAEMFEDRPGADAASIMAWVRHDVYAGLVAGARGVLVYSGFRRRGFTHYDDYFAAYLAVARELNGPLALGDVLLRGASCEDGAIEVLDGAGEVSFVAAGDTQVMPALGRRVIAHDGARFLWLVSSSKAALVVRASGWGDATMVSRSAGARHDGERVHLPAWGVAVLRSASPQ